MSPAEIEALVEQVGDEILGRLGLSRTALTEAEVAPEAPPSAWPRPERGYAAAIELVCGSAEATDREVAEACRRARSAGLPVVWTASSQIAIAVAELAGADARAGALIDFPSGAASTPARLADIETALRLGAELIHLVIGAGRIKSTGPDEVQSEVRAAASLCADAGAGLAVTFEAAQLSEEELVTAAAAALAGGADALCPSTGQVSHAYASDRAVTLLRQTAGDRAVVVGAGRIAGFGHAAALIAAGADRIATDDPWTLLKAAPAR